MSTLSRPVDSRPRKSPFWWVVRHCTSLDGSECEYLANHRNDPCESVSWTTDQRNAYPFKSVKDARQQAKMWRRAATVVRIRARSTT